MSHLIYRRLLLLLLILLVVFLTACGNSTPTPQTTTYTPGCSVQNLIDDIAQANNNSGLAVINLDPSCVYTLTTADNMMNIRGANVHTGLPVISTDIIIQGNNAEIEIQNLDSCTSGVNDFIIRLGNYHNL